MAGRSTEESGQPSTDAQEPSSLLSLFILADAMAFVFNGLASTTPQEIVRAYRINSLKHYL